jgi:hypothetical protein
MFTIEVITRSSIPWLHRRLRHERRRGFSRNATFSRTLTYRLLAGSSSELLG